MARAFDYKAMDFGMGQFHNGDVALVGGARTGKLGTPGTARLRFDVYDLAMMVAGTPAEGCKVGSVEINQRPFDEGEVPDIEGLVDITLLPGSRGRGIGRRVAEALAASSAEGLHVYDIKRKAVDFWRAVGCDVTPGTRAGQVVGRFEAPAPAASPSP